MTVSNHQGKRKEEKALIKNAKNPSVTFRKIVLLTAAIALTSPRHLVSGLTSDDPRAEHRVERRLERRTVRADERRVEHRVERREPRKVERKVAHREVRAVVRRVEHREVRAVVRRAEHKKVRAAARSAARSSDPITGNSFRSLGCFNDQDDDRDLPVWIGINEADDCLASCFHQGYTYFSLQGINIPNINMCWCGTSYGKHGRNNNCTADCARPDVNSQAGYLGHCIYMIE